MCHESGTECDSCETGRGCIAIAEYRLWLYRECAVQRAGKVLIPSLILVLLCGPVAAGGEPVVARAKPTVVLDTTGFWRLHHTLKPPLIKGGGGLKPVLHNRKWLDAETADPAAAWPEPDFDDSRWLRGPMLMALRTPCLSRLCMRGKFKVTDPKLISGLSLSLDFYGGAVVYLNGKQVAGKHVRGRGKSALGEAYPVEAFATSGGELIDGRTKRDAETSRRIGLRKRRLVDVAIPSQLLREGVNVLAIEIVRSPYPKAVKDKADPKKKTPYQMNWNTCEVRRVQLTAEQAEGLMPNATRPKGLQVWNRNLLASDFDMDFGDPCEELRPIRMVGARNGWFSGKVVVGSDKAIRGLAVSPSALEADAGTIPPSAVQVRYGIPWGSEYLTIPYSGEQSLYPAETSLLEALAEAPLDEFPVRPKKASRYTLKTPGQPDPVFGAVVPVWVTVKVPGSAKAGNYKGRITIRAEGETPVSVPVELKVANWPLPSPENHRTWVELIQSPDTLALEYGVDLWSEEHWRMIARSMRFQNEIGSRVLYVPLISETNQGNEQSMVRWIDKGNGKYKHDFSIMEKYLDLAAEHMGNLKIVIFNVWDVYLIPKDKKAKGQEANAINYLKQHKILLGEGPAVTVVDAATEKVGKAYLPPYSHRRSNALWRPLFKELLKRMKRRGLWEAMMLGTITDAKPTRKEVELLSELAPNVPWVCHSHHGWSNPQKNLLHGLARVAYQTRVWNISFSDGDLSKNRSYGWKRSDLLATYERNSNMNQLGATNWRHLGEYNITGSQRGIGRLGADFWSVIKDKRGHRKGRVWSRYPQSSRRNLDLYTSLLAPGPDGPVATTRFEVFRSGLQECEARIFIERALTDKNLRKTLGPALVKRCQDTLDERITYMYKGLSNLQLSGYFWDYATSWRASDGIAGHTWFISSGWQKRSEKLYGLAAQVAKKLR